jgi:hypothetical protein
MVGVKQWDTRMVDEGDKRITFMSTAEYNRQRHLRSARWKRYHDKHRDVDRHGPNRNRVRRERTHVAKIDRPFIFWDGEGPQDTAYSLFGNSAGYSICYPSLSSSDCINLILECGRDNPDAIHISFGFNYDVSMILKDMPRRAHSALAFWGKCRWGDWDIQHIPHKWFKIVDVVTKSVVKIFDIRSFFDGTYVQALVDFEIGTAKEIAFLTTEKARRPKFMWAEIEEIREYWLVELKLGPELANKLRESLDRAGYLPDSWHGPGALARMALKRHGVYDAMAKCPGDVRHAARLAYSGGRFDQYIIGEVNQSVYEADINSAYPFFATLLPNLRNGKWRHGCRYEPGKFALYHIRYCASDTRTNPGRAYPLFHRDKNYLVRYPHRVEGWYWSPEAELVANDSDAVFLESIVFDEDDPTDRPFAWLAEYYKRRKLLDKSGDIAGYGYKKLINAVYGQLAQRAGWDRKRLLPPKSHQLEWAGYMTSACRAAVYKAAVACGDKLISINTDSVQALCPLDDIVPTGKALGEWGTEEYEAGLFWQAGIYTLKQDGEWKKARTRGIPKGQYTTDQLREAIYTQTPITLVRKMFITYSLALMGQWGRRNTWNEEPSDYAFGGGPGSKRTHITRPESFSAPGINMRCGRMCEGLPPNMHKTFPGFFTVTSDNEMSTPHYLPWIDGPSELKDDIDGYMIDLNEDPGEWEYTNA